MAETGEYFLVPLDTDSSERIPVPDGDTILGRGPFLKITDKRVSRSHATLSNEGGKLLLRLKHATNPCFYKAAGRTTYTQMQKDAEQPLTNGDCFSFLPNSLRFELKCILKVTAELKERIACPTDHEAERKQDPDENKDGAMDSSGLVKHPSVSNPTVAECGPPEAGVDSHQPESDSRQPDNDSRQPEVDSSQPEVDSCVINVDSCQKHADTSVMGDSEGKGSSIQSDSNAATVSDLGKKRKLPVWLSSRDMKEEGEDSKEKKKAKGKTPAVASKPPTKKRVRISSDEDVKESAPTKKRSQRKAVKSTRSVVPRSHGVGSGDDKDEESSEIVPHTSKSPPTDKRPLPSDKGPPTTDKSLPPCPHGQSCYRKNPAHFKEYSHHQGDSGKEAADSDDSGDGDSRPECPYGTACYRRNPLHRQQYRHTAAPTDSPPRTSRTRRKKTVTSKGRSSVHDGENDDDDMPNTYDYNDSFIDDDGMSSGDSSGDDDSDEDWQHPGDDGGGGGGGGEESEEDVKELVKEAHEFVSNPKLRRR